MRRLCFVFLLSGRVTPSRYTSHREESCHRHQKSHHRKHLILRSEPKSSLLPFPAQNNVSYLLSFFYLFNFRFACLRPEDKMSAGQKHAFYSIFAPCASYLTPLRSITNMPFSTYFFTDTVSSSDDASIAVAVPAPLTMRTRGRIC